MPRPEPGKATISVRMDRETMDKLEAYADALVVSVNWLCNRAILEFLKGLPPVDEVVLKLTKE